VALYLEGPDPFAAAADRQIAAYLWTGVLVIALISIVALLAGRFLLRQVRLTRLKNDFIATVSHELKTPLSSMRVLVDTLLDGRQQGAEQAREYLQLVARENERLSRLIDNFLSFSRMERDKRAFELGPVQPALVASAAAEAVRARFESQGCRFEVELAPELPAILGDRDALVTVLLNLLDNAFKYSENERHIVLRAYAADGEVRFDVQDNGVGLSRRAIRKVFEPFYQVDRSLSRKAGGCGLGLSIVRFIVDAHGGSVDVKSQPGKGSTFTVRLPVTRVGG
jgi:signal transduction histidine kinase